MNLISVMKKLCNHASYPKESLQYKLVESKPWDLLQIFRKEKAFCTWNAWIFPLKKCSARSMVVWETGFLWCHIG